MYLSIFFKLMLYKQYDLFRNVILETWVTLYGFLMEIDTKEM